MRVSLDVYDVHHIDEFPAKFAEKVRKADVKTIEMPDEALQLPLINPRVEQFLCSYAKQVQEDPVPVDNGIPGWLFQLENSNEGRIVFSGIARRLPVSMLCDELKDVLYEVYIRVFQVHRDRDCAANICRAVENCSGGGAVHVAHVQGAMHKEIDYFMRQRFPQIRIRHYKDDRYPLASPMQAFVQKSVKCRDALACMDLSCYGTKQALEEAYAEGSIAGVDYAAFAGLFGRLDKEALKRCLVREVAFKKKNPGLYSTFSFRT